MPGPITPRQGSRFSHLAAEVVDLDADAESEAPAEIEEPPPRTMRSAEIALLRETLVIAEQVIPPLPPVPGAGLPCPTAGAAPPPPPPAAVSAPTTDSHAPVAMAISDSRLAHTAVPSRRPLVILAALTFAAVALLAWQRERSQTAGVAVAGMAIHAAHAASALSLAPEARPAPEPPAEQAAADASTDSAPERVLPGASRKPTASEPAERRPAEPPSEPTAEPAAEALDEDLVNSYQG